MKRIDELDIREIDGVRCCHGHPIPFGATVTEHHQVNLSINSAGIDTISLFVRHTDHNMI